MKKKELTKLLLAAGTVVLLAGCGETENNSRSEMPKNETETAEVTEAAPTEEPAEAEPAETEVPEVTEAPAETPEPVETEPEEDIETSPFALWEYEGYVDECKEYHWRDEFSDLDIDGDGTMDRLYRTCDTEAQTAVYTIEFGDGRKQEIPQGWDTGFPHVQAGDTDGDGEKELLFTLTYDTSTDPMAFGDMWVFDYTDPASGYQEVELPLAKGENGAKMLTIDYDKPDGDIITIHVKQNGYTTDIDAGKDFIEGWWTDKVVTEDRMVYDAQIKNGAIHCAAEVFNKSGISLEFDLVWKNGAYVIENMAY